MLAISTIIRLGQEREICRHCIRQREQDELSVPMCRLHGLRLHSAGRVARFVGVDTGVCPIWRFAGEALI